MNYGTKAQKQICYTFNHLFQIINNCTVVCAPKYVYVQCGTNDIEVEDLNCETIGNTIKELIENLKVKFENPVIVMSSILPRRDHKINKDSVNKILEEICDVTCRVKFLNHLSISENMLRDCKHLDRVGFTRLLYNIRFTLFGKVPKTKSRNDNRYERNRAEQNGLYNDNNRVYRYQSLAGYNDDGWK